MKNGRVECGDLVGPRYDDDVVRTDRGAAPAPDLLVAASEQETLAADDAEHERRRAARPEEIQQPLLVEIGLDQRPVTHGIDAERCPLDPECRQDPPRRRSGSEQIEATRLELARDLLAQCIQSAVARGGADRLPLLQQLGKTRHAGDGEQLAFDGCIRRVEHLALDQGKLSGRRR